MRRKRSEAPEPARSGGSRPLRTSDRKERGPRGASLLRDLQRTNRELSLEIRDLRVHQKNLEQVRTRYADLFDFAPVTYALLDVTGVVVHVNLAGCRLLDVERRDLIGYPLLGFVVQDDRRELLEHLRRCRAGKGMVESEVRFLSRSSRTVTCRLFSKRASYESQDAFPTLIIDQTEHLALDEARLDAERRRLHAERASEIARAASAAKDQFLAVVSHELRTPLTPALLAAGRLASWDGLPRQARKLAATVKRNIEFEACLIDDLLDVARINRNRFSLSLDTIDVHEVLRDAIAICEPVAQAKGVAVAVHLFAAAHHVTADAVRLRQVFWNLLNNAVKFTDPGGRIIVRSANASEDELTLSVRDSGAGMDRATLENLFAPFDRRAVDQESRMGLGLGLAICKGIVGAHGGQIWAASDGPGRGSTFAVELATVVRPQPEGIAPEEPLAEEDITLGAPPLRVLVIEDDAESREMLALFLSEEGYEVEVASSLASGLNRLEESWDVVLSDIGLPDGSGLEVARHARLMSQPPQRLIALTGYGSSEDIRASQNAGFDDHIVKPVDLDQLLNILAGRQVLPAGMGEGR
jgi:PAS domain S-box-containing protein